MRRRKEQSGVVPWNRLAYEHPFSYAFLRVKTIIISFTCIFYRRMHSAILLAKALHMRTANRMRTYCVCPHVNLPRLKSRASKKPENRYAYFSVG
jgi:hypothetical protein